MTSEAIGSEYVKEYCQEHESMTFEYISTDIGQENAFKCVNCIFEQGISHQSLIPINVILSNASSKNPIFRSFPFQDKHFSQEMQKVLKDSSTSCNGLQNQVDSIFNEFRTSILNRIDQLHSQISADVKNLNDVGALISKELKEISANEEFKRVLLDQKQSLSNRSSELQVICGRVYSKQTDNRIKIETLIEKRNQLSKSINIEEISQMQRRIIENIIDEFNGLQVNDYCVSEMKQYMNENLVVKNEPDMDQKIVVEGLMKLIRNRLNGLSDEQCARLEESMNLVRGDLRRVQVPAPSAVYEYLEMLDQESVDVISQLIKDLSENLRKNGKQHQEKQLVRLDVAQVIQLVKSSKNIIPIEFLEDVEGVIKVVARLMSQFWVRESKKCNTLKKMEFFKTKYEKSGEIEIQESENNVVLVPPYGKYGQVVSEILNREKLYEVKVEFNHPIAYEREGSFMIGLIPDSRKDLDYVLQNDHESGFYSREDRGAKVIVRGERITSSSVREVISSFTFSWCIARRYFSFSDETKENVNAAHEELINPDEVYRFGVCFLGLKESDWKVQISEVTE